MPEAEPYGTQPPAPLLLVVFIKLREHLPKCMAGALCVHVNEKGADTE